MPSFSQRNMFDVLDIEDGPDYEEVVEDGICARVKVCEKACSSCCSSRCRGRGEDQRQVVWSSGAKRKSEAQPSKAETKVDSSDAKVQAASPDTKAAPAKADQTPVKHSPPTSSFKPDLPADLPTRTAEELPANRKRKTPVDFSPSGPGNALTPTSPSKNSVKFEDGVVPGEGAEGEKTITVKAAEVAAPPKKQNFIERTVWTFIMIFGFIGALWF
ncbi:phosphatidate cytidylyltransferase [Trichosporon asahii var. asahii CBS 2479]|uniref:Phosphatidate cytidylyltransferase n=1 Tax=Trichosporon asahii var. asahii (strain ATCC 90039 / CBS 2479 / JCM 2466 / KCTC 7840 / NBRC 103889/ NCYC 2677 / UAMH 7654) TaxID=1186058 RepID=J4UBN2_TRIAS|nr:phosphatidate cytidylyltransferase [Trichosporon asahii var. asahii CBS 2479]EJT48295.1 phosphatidate cytidylyltransferase [Trichosporon asahii var. asahii CBS 2479]